jgi:hypothetical protein
LGSMIGPDAHPARSRAAMMMVGFIRSPDGGRSPRSF